MKKNRFTLTVLLIAAVLLVSGCKLDGMPEGATFTNYKDGKWGYFDHAPLVNLKGYTHKVDAPQGNTFAFSSILYFDAKEDGTVYFYRERQSLIRTTKITQKRNDETIFTSTSEKGSFDVKKGDVIEFYYSSATGTVSVNRNSPALLFKICLATDSASRAIVQTAIEDKIYYEEQ
ncbi:MAG: hypothetical protein HUK25_06750 [Treponema sp.]|nr:hypothetical protein [Treponema sp.]